MNNEQPSIFNLKNLLILILGFVFLFLVILPAGEMLLAADRTSHPRIALFALLLLLISTVINLWIRYFQKVHNRSVRDTRVRTMFSLSISVPITYLIHVLLPGNEFDPDLFFMALVTALFTVANHHLTNAYHRAKATILHRVLIFGIGPRAAEVAETLQNTDPNVRVVGFYPTPNPEEASVPTDLILPTTLSLQEHVRHRKVDEIVIALTERRGGIMPMQDLLDLRLSGMRIHDLAGFFEKNFGQIRLESLRAGWLIFGEGFNQGTVRTAVKRAFDIVFSLILLTISAPVMIIAALLIILESGFPIFYSQERVGLNGRPFKVVKFRSMRTDAEKEGKAIWATRNDSRVTRIGKYLRKLRIDELPQLFCVLKGDMSLVGPRPERPVFVDQLTKEIPFYAARHTVKPGVTGWAQVRYHYGSTVEESAEKLQFDLYYVKHHTLFFDLVVLFDTIGVVLTGKGAQ